MEWNKKCHLHAILSHSVLLIPSCLFYFIWTCRTFPFPNIRWDFISCNVLFTNIFDVFHTLQYFLIHFWKITHQTDMWFVKLKPKVQPVYIKRHMQKVCWKESSNVRAHNHHFKTQEISNVAILKNPSLLEYICNGYKNKGMHSKVIKKYSRILGFIPNRYKT